MATETFHERIESTLPAEALWTKFSHALEDTDRTDWWPRRLNRVAIPSWEPGTPFEATYRLAGMDTSRLPYRVVEVGVAHLIYSPTEAHPFSGQIEVRAESTPGGGCLHWGGRYEMAAWRPERLFFRTFFLPRFFTALRRGLSSASTSSGYSCS